MCMHAWARTKTVRDSEADDGFPPAHARMGCFPSLPFPAPHTGNYDPCSVCGGLCMGHHGLLTRAPLKPRMPPSTLCPFWLATSSLNPCMPPSTPPPGLQGRRGEDRLCGRAVWPLLQDPGARPAPAHPRGEWLGGCSWTSPSTLSLNPTASRPPSPCWVDALDLLTPWPLEPCSGPRCVDPHRLIVLARCVGGC